MGRLVLVARLSRNHAQRAQRLLVKLARVLPHPYNRPDHASHLFLAKSPHFAHHARIVLFPAQPRINFPNRLSYTKLQNASASATRLRAPYAAKILPALYPLASFLYRASLMMAMNRIANSDRSRQLSREGALATNDPPTVSAEGFSFAFYSPNSSRQRISNPRSAIRKPSILLQINHLIISNRRQTAPLSCALRAQKRELNER
jgi:hypothetical protein